ncbi:MAG: ATP-binding protein [Gammaproteobacteria bacterium]
MKDTDFSLLKQILKQSPNYIFWKDVNSIYLGCNNNFAKAAGFNSPKDIVGKTDAQLPWGQYTAHIYLEEDLNIIKTGKAILHKEVAMQMEGKHEQILSVSKIPLFENNKIIGILGIYIDITQRVLLTNDLHVAKEAAEASDRTKSEFIANMSHDVKTPLSGMIGLADILSRELQHPKHIEMIKMIYNAGNQLMDFFENCVEMIKLEADKVTLTTEDFNVQELLQNLVTLFKPAVEKKGLLLQVNCDPQLPPFIHTSKAGLYRILLNLLGNAIKFTPSGSITINVALDPSFNHLILTIIDTGIGIPKDKLEVIFERFSRVTPSHRGTFEGHGIGLYIIKKFVTDMGGDITVKSQLKKGSSFTVTLPFSNATSHQALPATHYTNTTYSILPVRHKILLIEDNILAQTVEKTLLTNLGYEVDVADTGHKALALFAPGKYTFIFMEPDLSDMQGADLIQLLRTMNNPAHPSVFIITLGTYQGTHLLAGADYALSKPLSKTEVTQMTLKFLNRQY